MKTEKLLNIPFKQISLSATTQIIATQKLKAQTCKIHQRQLPTTYVELRNKIWSINYRPLAYANKNGFVETFVLKIK